MWQFFSMFPFRPQLSTCYWMPFTLMVCLEMCRHNGFDIWRLDIEKEEKKMPAIFMYQFYRIILIRRKMIGNFTKLKIHAQTIAGAEKNEKGNSKENVIREWTTLIIYHCVKRNGLIYRFWVKCLCFDISCVVLNLVAHQHSYNNKKVFCDSNFVTVSHFSEHRHVLTTTVLYLIW